MNTSAICRQTEKELERKSMLHSFLNWVLRLKIEGAEQMSKTK